MIPEPLNIASRYVQRRELLLSLILLGLLFAVTAAMARMYHAHEGGLADQWFQSGNEDLAGGRPGKAFEDFQNALSYGPENQLVEMRLAEALLADGRFAEARAYLLPLWEKAPGSGELNLDLAHDSVQLGDADQAVRYFRGAIFGSWEKDPVAQRRKVRLELCEFFLSHGRTNEAQAEIAGLSAESPAGDGLLREETGHLFLRAREPGRALAEFEAALQTNPRESQWLTDAGEAAYEAGDYLKAENYFAKADRENPSHDIHDRLSLVRDLLGNDPYLAGLSEEEQSRRSWRDFEQALARLRSCAEARADRSPSGQPPSDLQLLRNEAQDLRKRMRLLPPDKLADMRNEAMGLVFRIEEAAAADCGPSSGMDQALVMIEKRRQGTNP